MMKVNSMKIQFSEEACFGANRWSCDAKVQWVRITEHQLVYQRRDNSIVTKKLKYINSLEVTNDTL